MKVKYLVPFLCFGTFIVACKKEKPLKEFMVDSWQTTYLKIEMKSYNNSDSLNIYEDKFDNNPELLAQSKYNKDGSFNAWFINSKGEKISESKGKWNVKKDSLFVDFFYNSKQMKVSYFIQKTEDGFIGKSEYDWDEDGKFDDFLTMKAKRINLN
jgi:hypothetical protein